MTFTLKRKNHKSRENHISDTMALFPPNQVKNIFYFRPKEKTTNQEKTIFQILWLYFRQIKSKIYSISAQKRKPQIKRKCLLVCLQLLSAYHDRETKAELKQDYKAIQNLTSLIIVTCHNSYDQSSSFFSFLFFFSLFIYLFFFYNSLYDKSGLPCSRHYDIIQANSVRRPQKFFIIQYLYNLINK